MRDPKSLEGGTAGHIFYSKSISSVYISIIQGPAPEQLQKNKTSSESDPQLQTKHTKTSMENKYAAPKGRMTPHASHA